MGFGFMDWDGDSVFKAGSIRRASSSESKVWGEVNHSGVELAYGVFVAVAPEGGVKAIESAKDVIHGVVMLDVYGNGAPADQTVNVGHFSHGDSIVVLAATGESLKRGDRVYVVVTGSEAGKVSAVAKGNADLGFWVEEVSAGNGCVAVTLGYSVGSANTLGDK